MFKRRYPIRIPIALALTSLVLLVGGAITWVAYQRTSAILTETALTTSQRAAQALSGELAHLLDPVRMGIAILAAETLPETRNNLDQRLAALPVYVSALRNAPAAVAFYEADRNGNFFLVRRLLDATDRERFSASGETDYVVQIITQRSDGPDAQQLHFDAGLNELNRRDSAEHKDFDARQRPWFVLAQQHVTRILTEPYRFFSSHKQGISMAQQASDGLRTIGADIRIDTLADSLDKLRLTPRTHLLLADESGVPLAQDSNAGAASPSLTAQLQQAAAGERLSLVEVDDQAWLLGRIQLPRHENSQISLSIALPERELMAEALALRDQLLATALGLLMFSLPLALWLAQRISKPIDDLAGATESIRRLDFTSPIDVHSTILEVNTLADSLRVTKSTLGDFLDILSQISRERNFSRLLPELLESTIRVTRADGGVLFLVEEQRLRQVAGQWQGEALQAGPDATFDNTIFGCAASLAEGSALTGPTRTEDCAHFGLSAGHRLTVPLFNRDRHPIGVLVLLDRTPIDPTRQAFIQALSGFAAMALETRELIATQKALFAAFIEVMAAAIDAKSPYTGGHCARVPEIAQSLAEAACAAREGTFADFSLDEDAWEALHIASWLHDCGKVTTPEYVVDKATKLETLYDRIHEIRMRFEVLKRDAEITCLNERLAGQPADQACQRRDALLAELDAEFAFVATCNEGGEFMAPEKVERLKQIASRSWRRTLDDRLGISIEERQRKAASPAASLPVDEPLLADKPEHRFPHHDAQRFGPGNPWGFAMRIPELQFDRGELKNLMIPRGTLADEERYKINEHIIQTIVMLSALPFPRHLASVPEIAGGHHERIDGKGYPRGLTGTQMSPLARIMAIADVFEALTAADRPYKPAKTLSQSLSIMKKMAEEAHIDREFFHLFLTSGSVLRYAERFLAPDQIDTHDFSAFLPAVSA
jgi:HD-GYP domain-containing protein (c-di-GMP phosphodiesterase class II)